MVARADAVIELQKEERSELTKLARTRRTPHWRLPGVVAAFAQQVRPGSKMTKGNLRYLDQVVPDKVWPSTSFAAVVTNSELLVTTIERR